MTDYVGTRYEILMVIAFAGKFMAVSPNRTIYAYDQGNNLVKQGGPQYSV
jgi:hypothetical protein